jgi:hypothetical protein
MKLKTTIDKQEFFEKLIKSKCNFKKICGVYPAKCKSVKYIGKLKNFKEMEVYQLEDEEAIFFRTFFKIFNKSGEIKEIKLS